MAIVYDINVFQNATFDMTMQLTDVNGSYIDITNWEFSGSIKSSFKDVTPVTTFNIGRISNPSGSIEITLNAVQTALLVKPNYHYDVIGKDKSTVPVSVYRLLQGTILSDPGVTPPL